ncbi:MULTISPECIES: DEAD/DEAH box helicase [unclassified Aureimonas]|uniref:DEAD/DEAH box helicase n=1 Tax=unclassified Aureimonas TaxID=2615206 RepID=UPI0006FC6A6E|nr:MULTISPECIES: DEAD/DEAH box helicase [unclassified Aureimonas]KQT66101.1 DEAD/DEAH box helicase [Aureimonas sp. Leaf427]KQT81035.1 DEAD/DEAH box helicase [Aureimonas sp. Leaf460]
MTHTTFATLGLSDVLLTALASANLTQPTPIQAQAIPAQLAGRDVLGIAQTGTGKTAAFALPVIHQMLASGGKARPKTPRAVFMAPTRELASQIAETVEKFIAGTALRQHVVFGGVSARPQTEALRRGVDIVVATPGRLLDLMDQGAVSLGEVEFVVLDEADRMLDMGFVRDVMRIVRSLPTKRQSLLFSATMPQNVESLAAKILKDPVRVEVTPEVVTVEKIEQSAYLVPQKAKKHWLIKHLADESLNKVVVFTRTKHGANRLAEDLGKAGIDAAAIHGNKSQAARQKALSTFHEGKMRVLVATDIVARGIHVNDISHVVNFDLPEEPESYVHRIGRTARAGKSGYAIALVDPTERAKLRSIERLTGQRFDLKESEFASSELAAMEEERARPPRQDRPRGAKPSGAPNGNRQGRPSGHGKPAGAPGGANRSAKPAGGGNRRPQRSRTSAPRAATS